MSRINKKTRIKGLPARLQLQQKDAHTGSFPSIARVASDNRTGDYQIQYDDLNTIGFGQTSNILDNVISYWRFNSGSSDEVTPVDVSFPSASFRIKPVFLNDSVKEQGILEHLYYRVAKPSYNDYFKVPSFTGPEDDPNLTSIFLNYDDQSVLSGSLALFNPGSETAVSGAKEKEFTIAFWTMPTFGQYQPTYPFQSVISVGQPSAILDIQQGTTVGLILSIERNIFNNSFNIILYDPDNNIIAKGMNTGVFPQTWNHFTFTYDGTKLSDSIQIYLNGEQVTDVNSFMGGTYNGMTSSIDDHQLYLGRLANDTNLQYDGLIDEVIFLDKALPGSAIKELYNFKRTLSKAKENPLTGIYYGLGLPTNSKFIKHPTEQTTSLFGTGKVVKGIGDSAATFTPGQSLAPFIDNNHPAVDGKSSGNSFYATGSKVEDVGPGFDQPLWSKTKIEIDLSVNGVSSFNTFFSMSGAEGFLSGVNYPMAYYNFNSKGWEGIGVGRPHKGEGGLSTAAEFNVQGFAPGIIDLPGAVQLTSSHDKVMFKMFEFQSGAGRVTDKFGFPFAARYHATSSQTYSLANVINEPFILEKIVFDFSGALNFDPEIQNGSPGVVDGDFILTASFVPAAVSNFFILNQRRPHSLQYTISSYVENPFDNPDSFTHTLPTSSLLTSGSIRTYVDSIRDLVSFGSITSFASNMLDTEITRSADDVFVDSPDLTRNPKSLLLRDFNIETGQPLSNSLSALDWSGRIRLEIPARSPNLIDAPFTLDVEALENVGIRNSGGGRNNLGVSRASGRDLLSPISAIQTTTPTGLVEGNIVLAESGFDKINPYVLLPTDQLIFGWQQPIILSTNNWNDITTGTGSNGGPTAGTGVISTMSMTGPAKVILYGSKIKNGRETHDTLNQLLTSEAVHEVIGND